MDFTIALQTLATIGALATAAGTAIGAVGILSDSVSGLWQRFRRAVEATHPAATSSLGPSVPELDFAAINKKDSGLYSPAERLATELLSKIEEGMNHGPNGMTNAILSRIARKAGLQPFSPRSANVAETVNDLIGLVEPRARLPYLVNVIMTERDGGDWTALRNWLKREIHNIEV